MFIYIVLFFHSVVLSASTGGKDSAVKYGTEERPTRLQSIQKVLNSGPPVGLRRPRFALVSFQ